MEPKPRHVASLPWQSCLGSKDWEMKLAFLQLRGFETCCPVLHIYGKSHTMFVWWYLTSSAWTYWKMMSRLLCPAYRSFHLPNDDKEPKGPGGGLCIAWLMANASIFYFISLANDDQQQWSEHFDLCCLLICFMFDFPEYTIHALGPIRRACLITDSTHQ